MPQKLWSIDLDNLITTMTVVEEQARAAEKLNVDPPNVLFVNEPAVLISIDGDPQIRDEDGVNRVINTPYTLVQDPENKLWYLNAGDDNWYGAKEITDEWQVANKVPTVISKLAPPPADKDELEDTALGDEETGAQPRIIVVTEPTELISSDGKPEFSAIEGTDLLYLSNTDSDVLMDIKEQLYYVLLSGRWYSSKSTQGPWVYVNGDDLPEDFPNIPEASEMSTVLYAVPGTIEAEGIPGS